MSGDQRLRWVVVFGVLFPGFLLGQSFPIVSRPRSLALEAKMRKEIQQVLKAAYKAKLASVNLLD